jgi:imidazolonepropionase-like amidohydrolase
MGGTGRAGKAAVVAVSILRNASVLDPERGELAEGQSVLVEDGRIADVGPGRSAPGRATPSSSTSPGGP